MKKLILISAMLVFSITCFSQTGNRKKAQVYTLESYKKIQQERLSMAKIKNYSIHVTTEEQFFTDAWDAINPFYGRYGVIGGTRNNDNLTIILGRYIGDDIPLSINIKRNSPSGFSFSVFANYSLDNRSKIAKYYQYFFEEYSSSDFMWEQKKG